VIPALLKRPDPGFTLIAIAHAGTLLAVIVYFWKDLWGIFTAMLAGIRRRQPMATPDARAGWFIVVGSIPAVIVGLALDQHADSIFGNASAAAFFLLVTSALLVVGERLHSGEKSLDKIGWVDAISIGLSQALAILPGISRSGSTIAMGLFRGLDRETAARYSFLLGAPAIAGAALLAIIDLLGQPDLPGQVLNLMATFIASALVGFLCIHFLLQWLRQHGLYPFAIYCLALSLVYFVVAAFG
jgi:undecaprenyl-diphosphatase